MILRFKRVLLVLLLAMGMFSSIIQAQTNGQEVESFVKRFYVEVLDREAEDEGLMNWTNRLTTQVSTGADVAEGFIFSTEFESKETNNSVFMKILYKAFFNRTADALGLAGWLAKLEDSTTRTEVVNGFLNSVEFANLAHSYSIRATATEVKSSGGTVNDFVKRFYKEVLGRNADKNGLNSWVEKLNTKQATGADIAKGFVFSNEFIQKNTDNVEYIETLYRAFFARVADSGGLNGWISQLDSGKTRADVLNGFLGSEEFINLTDGYHIVAFEGAPKSLLFSSSYILDENTTFTTTFTYDGKGNELTSIDEYSSNTSTYDAKGNRLTYITKNEDNTSSSSKFTYNDNRRVITSSTDFLDANDEVTRGTREVYTYDADGNVVTYIQKDINDNILRTFVYIYNQDNNLIGFEGRDAEGTVDETLVNTYDQNGNLLRQRNENPGGFYDETFTYDESGNLLNSVYITDVDLAPSTATYDSLGNVIKIVSDFGTTLYANDVRGNTIIVKTITAIDVSETFISYYAFEYDTHSNLLTRSVNGTVKERNEWIRIIPIL